MLVSLLVSVTLTQVVGQTDSRADVTKLLRVQMFVRLMLRRMNGPKTEELE